MLFECEHQRWLMRQQRYDAISAELKEKIKKNEVRKKRLEKKLRIIRHNIKQNVYKARNHRLIVAGTALEPLIPKDRALTDTEVKRLRKFFMTDGMDRLIKMCFDI